jgi:hypothetical protein
MKNKLLLGTLLVGIASLFTSCKDDREYNPTFQTPTEFTVNTPAMTDQYIQLSKENTVHLTWTQPNYGYNAYATYSIQVGVVQDDGSIKWCMKEIKDAEGNVTAQEDDYLSTNYYTCSADISAEEIAMAINQVDGVADVEDYVDLGYRKIAMRVRAALYEALTEPVSGSEVLSNPVTFNHMRAYAAIKKAGVIYLIGSPNEWLAPTPDNAGDLAEWVLTETEIGNKVYEATFDIPAGDLQFRFYTYLNDWGTDDDPLGSVGPQQKDAPINVEFTNNEYTDDLLQPGKGTWKFAGFGGGSVTFTVDLNTNKVKFAVN